MKYYLYLSKTKIEMLSAQVPASNLKGLSAGFSANLGVFSATIKTPDATGDGDLFEKAELVAKHLAKVNKIGTIDNPKSYIGGSLPMRLGTLWDYASDLLLFFGSSRGQNLAMIGASSSAIGESTRIEAKHSLEYYSMRFLNGIIDSKEIMTEGAPLDKLKRQESRDYETYMSAIERASTQLPQEVQNIEFLARVMFVDKAKEPGLIVATPLFAFISD